MPAGPRVLLEGACYHIMVRGNRKRNVFNEDKDFLEYLERVKKYKRKHKIRIYAFCLMPNHIHLVGEIQEKGSLAKFMHGINRSYTAYFNDKYGKVGHLWQGRFKSKVVIKDRYLLDCINYIEQNPVRAKITRTPERYKWSSYKERSLGVVKEEEILDSFIL